ncbi:Bro-N domain-containing protein [Xenorhabdus hominickii]|uniref:Antirepressor protein n=1 Tax=Xenorhabdus hominickii TaxID=351679 RepID=A0A2G0QEU9_XENHO|nr:Bro-N domain-containing protein [Xenorhabdus hominickii]PHM57728.1 antirepressor protein [Xenorhabdus hominickii]
MTKKMALIGQGLTHSENSQEPILNIDSADISFIKFEGVQVRIFKNNNEPWFIAADVCKALGITNPSKALKALDLDEKNTVTLSYGIQGNPKRAGISESGFYKLITRSRKATKQGTFAHRFANWVSRLLTSDINTSLYYSLKVISSCC